MKSRGKLVLLAVALLATEDLRAGAVCSVLGPETTHAWKARAFTAPAQGQTLQAVLPLLEDGDLIFIRNTSALLREVAKTTGSWESHVGMIFRDADGRWMVAESRVPLSRYTPLAKFVARSEHGRFEVTRLRGGLTPEEKIRLWVGAQERMGKLYHPGFNYDSKREFCSKFVHDIYAEALGCDAGEVETFRQVLRDNPRAPMTFWRVWFCGFIPWDRRCITTTSVLHAPDFHVVFDSENAAPIFNAAHAPGE